MKIHSIKDSRELFASLNDETKEVQEISDKINELVDLLVDARVSKGLTQRDLSSILGWKQPALARFERLDNIPGLDTFLHVAKKLGATLYLEFEVSPSVLDYNGEYKYSQASSISGISCDYRLN